MIEILTIIGLGMVLLFVFRRGLIHVDYSMPWLFALVAFGFLSTNDSFVDWAGKILGVTYAPIAIVFIAMSILLGLIIVLLMAVTRLQQRQMQIIRQFAITELAGQEDTERVQAVGAPLADAPNAVHRKR
jgi:hypothetical protein